MTPEQRNEIIRLAAEWSDTSYARGLDRGNHPETGDKDRAAADAFYAYLEGLSK